MTGLIARTSTIFIATGNRTQVYRSISEVPPLLRRKLQSSTRGMNSATILIADKRGREELVKALQGHTTEGWSILANAKPQEPSEPAKHRLPSVRTWLELFLPVVIGASLWLLIDSHF